MKTWQSFTYPTFMGLCGLLAALSDIAQNATIANGVTVGLGAIGVLFIVFGRRIFSIKLVSQALGSEFDALSPRPFGLSCLVLALFMSGWTYLSVNSASANGLIGSTVPEIGQLQQAFGWIDEKLNRVAVQNDKIKDDTEKLISASRRWITLYPMAMSQGKTTAGNDWKIHYFPTGIGIGVRNETSFNFSKVHILVKDTDTKKLILSEELPVLARDQHHQANVTSGVASKVVDFCMSAENTTRGEWVLERRKLELFQRAIEIMPEYRTIAADEPTFSSAPAKCS